MDFMASKHRLSLSLLNPEAKKSVFRLCFVCCLHLSPSWKYPDSKLPMLADGTADSCCAPPVCSHHITEKSSTVSPLCTNVYNKEGLWAGISIPLPDLQLSAGEEAEAVPRKLCTYICRRAVTCAFVGGTGDKVKRDFCSLVSVTSVFSLNMVGKHFPSRKYLFV